MIRHGLCHGTTPALSFSIIRTAMMVYTSIAISLLVWRPLPRRGRARMDWAKPISLPPLPLHPVLRGSGRNGADAERSEATHERGGAFQGRRARAQRSEGLARRS